MSSPCVTGKKMYDSLQEAEEALVETWIRYNYRQGSGPKAVYQCDDCHHYHFTSQGTMNEYLLDHIESGYIDKQKRMRDWEDSFRF